MRGNASGSITRIVAFLLILLFPFSSYSSDDFGTKLRNADKKCHISKNAKKGRVLKVVNCMGENERLVWAKFFPQFLDIYDWYSISREETARKYDAGELSASKFTRLYTSQTQINI